uniref:Uncharacterized protein n=1 Tax=Oryctolagus cuniculus TaxID=9986 RepID=A0A5F9C435_RABIT
AHFHFLPTCLNDLSDHMASAHPVSLRLCGPPFGCSKEEIVPFFQGLEMVSRRNIKDFVIPEEDCWDRDQDHVIDQ